MKIKKEIFEDFQGATSSTTLEKLHSQFNKIYLFYRNAFILEADSWAFRGKTKEITNEDGKLYVFWDEHMSNTEVSEILVREVKSKLVLKQPEAQNVLQSFVDSVGFFPSEAVVVCDCRLMPESGLKIFIAKKEEWLSMEGN